MPVNRKYIILLFMLVLASCIDPFEPLIEERQEVMVIEGVITDQPGIHRVKVSRSTPYNDPSFMAVQGCVVSVEDNLGNITHYSESWETPGIYEAWLDEPFLGVGKSYALHVLGPNGKLYQSDHDTLLACPPVDSIYYENSSIFDPETDKSYQGLQFYNNMIGENGGCRNYRWKLTETWEYHSPYTADYVWLYGNFVSLLEDTVSTCYLTEPIRTVYAASTNLLTENRLVRNKLHYVSNQTPRLGIRYSLLIEQQSLSEQAYRYWNELKAQSDQSASLYETQPASVPGNIYNNNSNEKVLGCFYATQAQEKRVFIEAEELDFTVGFYTCVLDTIQDFSGFVPENYYYLFSLAMIPPGPPWLKGPKRCFDCTEWGGENEKPDFW
jgi:Domain of unknown function (DUF4249)